MGDHELGDCVRCGGALERVRGTIVPLVRCSTCGRGGAFIVDDDGNLQPTRSPATSRHHGSGFPATPLVADGGRDDEVTTGEDFLCHYCGVLHPDLGAAVYCCSDQFDDSGLELATDGGFERCREWLGFGGGDS